MNPTHQGHPSGVDGPSAPLAGPGGFTMRSCLYGDRFRWVDGRVAVAAEEPLEVRVDGVPRAVLLRTPGHEVELAVGFCVTEGLVGAASEIFSTGFGGDEGARGRNVVEVRLGAPPGGERTRRGDDSAAAPRVPGADGHFGVGGGQILEDLQRGLEPLGPGPVFSARDLWAPMEEMLSRQDLGLLTNGTHAAALVRPGGELAVVREDIGRHNAIDKAVGHAVLQGIDRAGCALLLSGRVSVDLVHKAVRGGFGLVAATSAATGLAVELADRMNCTLVGRMRGSTLTLYTHPSRIAGAPTGYPFG